MAKNKKPRKAYSAKPRRISIAPHQMVISGMWVASSIPSMKVKATQIYAAIDNVMEGRAVRRDVDTILNAMWMTRLLMQITGCGEEYADTIIRAEAAARTLIGRGYSMNGRYLFTGEELQLVRKAMELHESQLDVCTVSDIEKANVALQKEYNEIVNRVKQEEANASTHP